MRRSTLAMIRGVLLWLALPFALNAQFTYTINNGMVTITGYTGPGGPVVIPNKIDELPVVSIGGYAFQTNSVLTEVIIPDSVTAIGWWAFWSCTNLTNVTIGEGVGTIGDGAFQGCHRLANVTIPHSVIWIGGSAFAGCASLTSVVIPGSLFMLGDLAFDWCSSLSGVFFEGNAPARCGILGYFTDLTVYYLPGTTGWGSTLVGRPTAVWVLPSPVILTTPPGFGVGTNGYGFVISWATNASVVVEACADLALQDWSPVGTNTLVAGWSYFSDPQWTNYAHRFYRLRSP
jgi:hypothetical protein